MTSFDPKFHRLCRLLTLAVLFLGLLVRGLSYRSTVRLQGGVDLFALTMREFRLHGRLFYPMKHKYRNRVSYSDVATPASQHPPLWSLAAGAVASTTDTEDTFLVLKGMSFLSSLALLVVVYNVGRNDEHRVVRYTEVPPFWWTQRSA